VVCGDAEGFWDLVEVVDGVDAVEVLDKDLKRGIL
jgi:hypothetical protein